MLAPFTAPDPLTHYIRTTALAFLIVALSQFIGLDANASALAGLFLRSASFVAFWVLLQVAFADVTIRLYANQLGLLGAAMIGVCAGAIPAGALSLVTMMVGPTVDDFTAFLDVYIWFVLHHLILGSLLWGTLCLAWWRERFQTLASPASAKRVPQLPVASSGRAPMQSATDTAEVASKLSTDPAHQLLSVSAKGHYVRVRTDQSDHFVLMRFADALQHLHHCDGLQIHRSHWVARDGVAFIHKDGGHWLIELTDGTRLPASRRHRAALSRFFKSKKLL